MAEKNSWRNGPPLADTSGLSSSPVFNNGYKTQSLAQLPRLRRSSSGTSLLPERKGSEGLGGFTPERGGGGLLAERPGTGELGIGAIGSSGLRAVRTARLLSSTLELLAPAHLIEVRKALATLQGAGLHEIADVSGLHEVVVAKLAEAPPTTEATEPEVMLAPALQTGLVFDFTQEQLEDTDGVGKGLIGLRTLRSLRLRFCRCPLTTVIGLGKGIRELSALKELHIDFAGCTALTNVDELGKGIAGLYGLDTLYLNFPGCSALESVAALAQAISALTSVKTLTLNFQDCTLLTTDAAVALGKTISALKELVDLDLNVCGSRVRRGNQRPTILEPGPLGITNHIIKKQSGTATKAAEDEAAEDEAIE